MSNRTFLDIDDSIRTRNLLLPNKDRDTLNNQVNDLVKQFDSKPFFIIQPSPGICVKAKTYSGEKVFLNICVSDKIPPPEDISDTKLYELINDEIPDYKIPISIGFERLEMDKSGISCATYDVMINSAYLKKCQEKKHFMAFTILVILSGVTDKSGKELNTEDYIILKNRAVFGKLQQHRIENREIQKPQDTRPLIEEISHTKIIDEKLKPNDSKTMGYVILKEPFDGPAKCLIAIFEMGKDVLMEDVVVLLNSSRINITDEKGYCSYDIFLPYTLKINTAKASLDCNIGVLRLDVMVEQE